MRTEIIDGKKCIIGRGEDTVLKILHILFPKAIITRQVSISHLVTAEEYKTMDTVHKKHTADLVVNFCANNNKKSRRKQRHRPSIVVQVQDKSHLGEIASRKDSLHKKWFKKNNLEVVDVLERECPNIFREKLEFTSIMELCEMFKMCHVKFGGNTKIA